MPSLLSGVEMVHQVFQQINGVQWSDIHIAACFHQQARASSYHKQQYSNTYKNTSIYNHLDEKIAR